MTEENLRRPVAPPVVPAPAALDFDSDAPLDIGWDGSCDLGCESCQ